MFYCIYIYTIKIIKKSVFLNTDFESGLKNLLIIHLHDI